MTILQDPVRPFDPSMPAPSPRPGEEVLTAMRPRGSRGKTSFELASRGGYVTPRHDGTANGEGSI